MQKAAAFNRANLDLGDAERIEVDAARLDDVLDEPDRSRVSLIKIDTQGSEAEVLRGARETLRALRPPSCWSSRPTTMRSIPHVRCVTFWSASTATPSTWSGRASRRSTSRGTR